MTPQLRDDGHDVTLDLHGTTVAEAERLIRSAVRLAASRGRSRLTVVHGTSTSSRLYRNRTIRHALYDLLDSDALPEVTSDLRREGACLLGLAAAPHRDDRRLTLGEVRGV